MLENRLKQPSLNEALLHAIANKPFRCPICNEVFEKKNNTRLRTMVLLIVLCLSCCGALAYLSWTLAQLQ